MRTRVYQRKSFSAGQQNASSWLLRQLTEIFDGRNARFNVTIGEIVRRNGYEKSGNQFSTTSKVPVGGHVAQFSTGPKTFVAVPNDANTFTLVRHQNNDGSWTTDISDIPIGADVYFCDFNDEVYVSGVTTADGIPFQPYNIDKTLNVSQSRNLQFAPWPKYFVVYRGILHGAYVKVNGTVYPDRFYRASAPTGAFTFVRGDQTDVDAVVTYVSQVPMMTSNSAPFGTVTTSSEASGFEGWHLFDRSATRTAGSWITATSTLTGTVQYDFGSGNAKVITYYQVRALASSPTLPGDANGSPKDWKLQGSNNGSSWTDLHTVATASAWTASEVRTYSVANTTAYRYYRINVSAVQNTGSATYLTINEMQLMTSTQGIKALQLDLDSVRYVKAGQILDIYPSGGSTRKYTITVYSVDKTKNQILYLPTTRSDGTADNTTEKINFSSALSTTDFPTGTPVKFNTTVTMPGGVTAGTIYYVIRDPADDTYIKLAATYDQALIGDNILISSNGSGVLTMSLSYVLSNNDEIYVTGRHDVLTTLWNTDYPTPDTADWSSVQTGADSNNAITGVYESSNRLMVFTLNSASRFDGRTTITFNKRVGCVGQRTIQGLDDDWIIWLDSRGRIWARNEGAGQQQYISRGIHNELMSKIPLSQLVTGAAGVNDQQYILYLGLVNNEPTRAVYDFGSNTWAVDTLHHKSLFYDTSSKTGTVKPYFFCDNGYVYMDDYGDLDDDQAISFILDLGITNYGSEAYKEFIGAFIYSRYSKGLKIEASVDYGEPSIVAEIEANCQAVEYMVNEKTRLPKGTLVNIRILGAIKGPPHRIQAFYDFYNVVDEVSGRITKSGN